MRVPGTFSNAGVVDSVDKGSLRRYAAGMGKASKADDLISVVDASRILNISRVSVGNNIRTGRLPARRVGRSYVLKRSDVEAFEPPSPGRPRKRPAKGVSRRRPGRDG